MDETNYEKNCSFMRKSVTLDNHPKIEGYDFNKKFDFNNFINSYFHTGFQASNLGQGIEIVNQMRDDKCTIMLSMTGNVISSGLREIITYLVKNKYVDAIVTSAAGIEEDIIKCFKPFVVGDFNISGRSLFENGVGRIGNIFAPFDRYLYFEKFIDPFLNKIYKKNKTITTSELIRQLGLNINNKESYLYWAAKNNIKIYCPAIDDGALGDLLYFFKRNHKDFVIDTLTDRKEITDYCIKQKKLGAIVLGGGTPKHYLLNACVIREGFDYAVYITTAHEFDGSDSGGNQEEAKTWAKIKVDAPTVKIKCEFTIAFPLLVAGTFARN